MAVVTRETRVAVVEESTEGTLLAPSSASMYVPVLPDFSLVPAFEEIANEELRGSIGVSKPIKGLENPEATVPFYCKNSGVVGTEPDGGSIFEAAFGAVNSNSTEHDTTAATAGTSAARATLTLDVGEGASHPTGSAVLIKDSTNGYNIRNVRSVSGDVLTLAQNLSVAPGNGTNTGRAILYYPADSAHKSLSVWDYRGNGGAIQAMAGGRVTSLELSAEAGQPMQWSATIGGLSFYWDPIEITSADRYLDFNDGTTDYAAVIASGWYASPHHLAAALQTAMAAAHPGGTYTVAYSDSTGRYTLTKSAGTFRLEWNTGSNAANTVGDKIGFSTAADDTGALTYTSDNAITLSSPQTPSFANVDLLTAKHHEVIMGDFDDISCVCIQSITATIETPKTDISCICAESGRQGSVISERTASIEIVAYLDAMEADRFRKLKNNDEIVFTYNGGEKSGGNWVAGKCVNLHARQAVIQSIELEDADGIVVMNMTIVPFVSSDGVDEIYLNFI